MASEIPKKLKADDYLQELVSQTTEVWLKNLISKIIFIRQTPDETFLDDVYQEFLAENGLGKKVDGEIEHVSPVSNLTGIPAVSGFILKSLKHESGVNALEPGATIPFHQKLTVIYGKNGSGKSGFVRILKKVAGSRTQEDVWQNVHSARTQNQCEAKIEYTNGARISSYQWNGESDIAPFNQMAIFDGQCIPIYLENDLDLSYQPYGFELFQALSNSLQELQERLANDIQTANNTKPPIHDLFNEVSSVGRFVAEITALTKPQDLNKLPVWDAKVETTLKEKIKEQRGLQNLDQQSELLRTRQQKLQALEDALLQIQSDLSPQNIKVYSALITKFNELKKKQITKKGKTLEDYDIKEKESDEWERFIEAGEDYINIAEHDEYPADGDVCIYCQQKLSKSAQKLIELYREIFTADETSDLEEIETKLDEAIDELKSVSFVEDFPYLETDFGKLLPKRIISAAFSAFSAADKLAQRLATSLKKKNPQKPQLVQVANTITNIRKAKDKIKDEIKVVDETQRNIFRKSQELNKAITELQDIQKLTKHRASIEKYINLERWVAKATPLQMGKLNTKSITDLGKRAWRELVSNSFKERFEAEATDLNAPKVSLEFHGEYGSQLRAKSLEGLNEIDQFLSEGEQKAVALADFFAELSLQNEQMPVIFDDPATSFDHDRKEKIAKRIVQESTLRQVIVFTHDLMFASYLHDQVEGDNGSLDTSKASFHDLHSEADRIGIVTENYYPGAVKFDAYVGKIDVEIMRVEALTGEAQADGMRNVYGMLRRAVEMAVEQKIFGKVINRWSDQIQMRNATRATLNPDKLKKAHELHEEFSRYIEAHNQSNEMMQHASLDITRLKKDFQQVKDLANSAS